MSDKQLQNSFTTEYKQWLNEIKQKFQSSQIKASIQVYTQDVFAITCGKKEIVKVAKIIKIED